jgi:hypothetical protein
MELEHLEPILLKHGEDIATIKAKLFNGLTGDIAEIKTILKSQNESFAAYQLTRESTCPLNRRSDKKGTATARLVGIVAGAVAINTGLATFILKAVGVF